MNRFVLLIVAGVTCILIPVVGLLYFYRDFHQPKLGAVGNGKTSFITIPALIPIVACFILGIGNFHAAIVYRRQETQQHNKEKDNNS